MSDANFNNPPISDPTTRPHTGMTGQKGDPNGLGGWLILVGIGMAFAVLRTFVFIFVVFVPMFSDGTLHNFMDSNARSYDPYTGRLIIFELIANVVFLAAYLGLLWLFAKRSRHFPNSFVAVTIFYIGMIFLDAWLAKTGNTADSIFDLNSGIALFLSIIWFAIWVPYMLYSKRVKNTFVV